MTLYFNNSMSFYLQHTLKSTHINLDTSGKLANLRRDLRHINTFCSALGMGHGTGQFEEWVLSIGIET